MIITIWEAVFPGKVLPIQIAYIQAVNWLVDMNSTMLNVCGDTMVTRMVAHILGERNEHPMNKRQTLAAKAVMRRSVMKMPEEHRTTIMETLDLTNNPASLVGVQTKNGGIKIDF